MIHPDEFYVSLKLKEPYFISLNKSLYWFYSLGMFLFLGLFASPVFAEVDSIQADRHLFYKDAQIKISGTVETGSTGLVTIVIHDQNDEFVLLTHSEIHHDDSFEKKINVEDKFIKHGLYSVTGFIFNMTDAATVNFSIPSSEPSTGKNAESYKMTTDKIMDENKSAESLETINTVRHASFLDSGKDPLHYVERYYSEPHYKSWFDRNYPGQNIEETVGYVGNLYDTRSTVKEILNAKIIPEAQASSMANSSNQTDDELDAAQIFLALTALGTLFGAVYLVKRQADSNTRQILLNKNIIRKKILDPILRSNPKEIIQRRLAKGEITFEEYDRLKSKLG